MKKTILTGAQPNKNFHLGNYLGAFKNWAKLQSEYNSFFFIVDLHAITTQNVRNSSKSNLAKQTLDCAAQYIACGLNPEEASIFVQSHVFGHTELSWILTCLTPLGQLQRMTQFKDKSAKQETIEAGLLCYPVLMASDILLYNAHVVPVGEDQKQHVELTRDLAIKFNSSFSPIFNIPEPVIFETGARIMSLQKPEAKMSKSDDNEKGTIFLFEPIDSIRKKIMSSVTDSESVVKFSEDKPGISNLLQIASVFENRSCQEIANEFETQGYGKFKAFVADLVIEHLKPIQEKYQSIIKDQNYISSVLKKGAEKAQEKAFETLKSAYEAVGFLKHPMFSKN